MLVHQRVFLDCNHGGVDPQKVGVGHEKYGAFTHQKYRETGIYNDLKVWLVIEASPVKNKKDIGKKTTSYG